MISSDSNLSCSKDTTEKRKRKKCLHRVSLFLHISVLDHKWNLEERIHTCFPQGTLRVRGQNLFSWFALIWLPPVFLRHQAIKHCVAQTDLRLTEMRLPLAHPESSFRNAFWALWQILGIINSCCFPSPPSPSVISPLYALSLTASSLFLAESQQLAGTSRVILYVTQNPLCWLPWCFKEGLWQLLQSMLGPPAQPSFEALKQAAGRSLGVLRAPECLANMASQNPRAPAAAEMLLRSKPLRNSEQNPGGQRQSHMASQSQWLPGNSLKPARALAPGLEPCQRLNSGMGGLVTFSFSSQRDLFPRLRRVHMEAGSHHLSLSLPKINAGPFK